MTIKLLRFHPSVSLSPGKTILKFHVMLFKGTLIPFFKITILSLVFLGSVTSRKSHVYITLAARSVGALQCKVTVPNIYCNTLSEN